MLTIAGRARSGYCDGVSRRDFLRDWGAGARRPVFIPIVPGRSRGWNRAVA